MLISNLQSVILLVGNVYRREHCVDHFLLVDEKENSQMILL